MENEQEKLRISVQILKDKDWIGKNQVVTSY